jgi:hypothetical protein
VLHAPAQQMRCAMCERCNELHRKIGPYQRFLSQPIDTLTKERINAGMEKLSQQRALMHVRPDDDAHDHGT